MLSTEINNKRLIIISGISSFLGRSLKVLLYNEDLLEINRNSSIYKNKKFQNSNISSYENIFKDYEEIFFIHLASFYSLDEKNKKEIFEANIKFGSEILKILPKTKTKKILYTNTVFTLSNNKKILNSSYVKTKKNFSTILSKYTKSNNIAFLEIFLSNIYGPNDTRNKILDQIINNYKNNKNNPVLDKSIFINLMHVNDVAKNIINNLFPVENGKYLLISKKLYKLHNIFYYLEDKSQIQAKVENLDKVSNIEFLPKIIYQWDLLNYLDRFRD